MSVALYLDGSSVDLGVVKEITQKTVTNLVTVPPFVSGDQAETINFGYPYFIYELSGTYIGTETQISNFLDIIIGAMEHNTNGSFHDRFDTGGGLDVVINKFNYDDVGGSPNKLEYILDLLNSRVIG